MVQDPQLPDDERLIGLRARLEQAFASAAPGVAADASSLARDALVHLARRRDVGLPHLDDAALLRAAHRSAAIVLRRRRARASPGARSELPEVVRRLASLADLRPGAARPLVLALLGHDERASGSMLNIGPARARRLLEAALVELDATDERALQRLSDALAAAAEQIGCRVDCAPPETLYEAAQGAEDPVALYALLEGVLSCPGCAEVWRLALQLAPRERVADVIELFPAGAPGPEPTPPDAEAEPAAEAHRGPEPGARRRPWLTALAAVATVGLAVAVAVVPTYYRPQVEAPLHLPSLTSSTPGAVDGPPLRLTWEGAPAGSRYEVELATVAGERVAHRAGLTVSSWDVPDDALRPLPVGTTLVWQVLAVTPNGDELRSPGWTVRIGRAHPDGRR